MLKYNTMVVLAGTSLLGASAGLAGTFAVLRRRALTGDAIAHAALPGLCLAFLLTGERRLAPMLFGSLLSGLAGVATISFLRHYTRLREDAAIGLVLSVFFGAGLALSRIVQQTSTAGSKAGLDSFLFGKTAGIILEDVYWIGGVAAFSILAITMLYKELLSVSFDVGFAKAQGWPTYLLDLSTMVLVAATVVIGLPAVGVVMVSALLILPAAAARFWTERLAAMLALAGGFGLLIGLVGTAISAQFRLLPAGPVIVLTGSALFFVSMLTAPRRGLAAKWRQDRRFRNNVAADEAIFRVLEGRVDRRRPPPGIHAAKARGDVEFLDEWKLTPKGKERAEALRNGRRLWLALLEKHPEWAATAFDLEAVSPEERVEPEVFKSLVKEIADGAGEKH